MGITAGEHSAHGSRATASTLLNASNLFSIDAIERSLAHQDSDAVRRACARGDAMTERRKMAQWWADHLDKLRGTEVNKAITIANRPRGLDCRDMIDADPSHDFPPKFVSISVAVALLEKSMFGNLPRTEAVAVWLSVGVSHQPPAVLA
jgi:hypothetical protein